MAYGVYPNEVRLVGGISLLIQTDLTTAQVTQTLHCILACHGNDKFKIILPYTYACSQLICIPKIQKKISPQKWTQQYEYLNHLCHVWYTFHTLHITLLSSKRTGPGLEASLKRGLKSPSDFSVKKQRCFSGAYLSVSVWFSLQWIPKISS